MAESETLDNILNLEDLAGFNITIAFASYENNNNNNVPVFRRLNIDTNLRIEFQNVINSMVSKYKRYRANNELRLIEYSPEYKPNSHELEWIRIADNEFLQNIVNAIPNPSDIPISDHSEEFISNLAFYVLILEDQQGNKYFYFRIYKPNQVISHSTKIYLKLVGRIYERMEEPAFQFDRSYDVVLNNGYLYILSKTNFHSIFKYYQEVIQMADSTLNQINDVPTISISNFEEFRNACMRDPKKLSKLRSIANKGYLNRITMEDIKRVIQSHNLNVQISNNNGTEELVYDSSDQWALLNLLDDCYLTSNMTEINYEANSKRETN